MSLNWTRRYKIPIHWGYLPWHWHCWGQDVANCKVHPKQIIADSHGFVLLPFCHGVTSLFPTWVQGFDLTEFPLLWNQFLYQSTKVIIGKRPCMLKYIIGSPDNLHFSFDDKCHPQPSPFTCQCPKRGKVSVFCLHLPVPWILSVTDGCFSFLPLVPQSHTFCSEFQSAQLFKITTQLSFHDDHMLIACTDFTAFPPSPSFSLSHIFSSSYSNYSVGQALQQLNSLIFFQVQSAWKKTQTFKTILIIFQKICCRDTTIFVCSDWIFRDLCVSVIWITCLSHIACHKCHEFNTM